MKSRDYFKGRIRINEEKLEKIKKLAKINKKSAARQLDLILDDSFKRVGL